MKFIKSAFGPDTPDDEKLMKRTKRAWKVNNWTNFYGCCGSWSIMGAVGGLFLCFAGLPWVVPVAMAVGGVTVLATAVPAIKLTEKIEGAFNTEVRKRGLWKPEWDEDYCPPDPFEEEFNRQMEAENAKTIPVLAEIFDPKAAVTLGGDIRAMPSIKLKAQPRRPAA